MLRAPQQRLLAAAPGVFGSVASDPTVSRTIAALAADEVTVLAAIAGARLGARTAAWSLAGKDAPSWLAADRLKSSGHRGILVPSFVPGATEANINLVLWRWGPDLPHKVNVYDPSGRLPRNQLSWPTLAGRM